MRKLKLSCTLLAAALLLAACPRAVRPPEKPASAPPERAADTRGATIYTVDPAASTATIHVYRGGKLARLGHNHVMTSKDVRGRAWIHPTFARSGFELSFPVAELIVDDPDARRAAGAEFASAPSASDKEGTRKNMLRAEVLDAEHYPEIRLTAARVGGALQAPEITARITIREVAREVDVPTTIQLEGGRLRASGAFDILQTDFGVKPFSVALGALEVQDRVHVEFDIVGVKK